MKYKKNARASKCRLWLSIYFVQCNIFLTISISFAITSSLHSTAKIVSLFHSTNSENNLIARFHSRFCGVMADDWLLLYKESLPSTQSPRSSNKYGVDRIKNATNLKKIKPQSECGNFFNSEEMFQHRNRTYFIRTRTKYV